MPLLPLLLLACGAPAQPPAPAPVAPAAAPAPAPAPAPAQPAPAPVPEALPQPARVVAVGDLHGDLDNALAVLKLAGITDDEGHWVGGQTVFVQTGDVTDRGPDSGALIDLLTRLVGEAEAAGGSVVPLLGNHEVMNLVGDWRYVDPGDVAAYGGIEQRKDAYSPGGTHGRWLRERDVVGRVGDAVFVHGGVTPAFAALGIDRINDQARSAIAAGSGAVLESDGPLWFRDYVNAPESAACPPLEQAVRSLGATRMVVGHTTRRDGKVEARCGGRLLVIDIGIADHYGANLGAIEIVDGDARALYPSGPVDLPDPE